MKVEIQVSMSVEESPEVCTNLKMILPAVNEAAEELESSHRPPKRITVSGNMGGGKFNGFDIELAESDKQGGGMSITFIKEDNARDTARKAKRYAIRIVGLWTRYLAYELEKQAKKNSS